VPAVRGRQQSRIEIRLLLPLLWLDEWQEMYGGMKEEGDVSLPRVIRSPARKRIVEVLLRCWLMGCLFGGMRRPARRNKIHVDIFLGETHTLAVPTFASVINPSSV
jgi:hypothetical protein